MPGMNVIIKGVIKSQTCLSEGRDEMIKRKMKMMNIKTWRKKRYNYPLLRMNYHPRVVMGDFSSPNGSNTSSWLYLYLYLYLNHLLSHFILVCLPYSYPLGGYYIHSKQALIKSVLLVLFFWHVWEQNALGFVFPFSYPTLSRVA